MSNDNLHKRLSSLTEITKAQLSKILNFVAKTKDLVIQPEIIRPLERICGMNWLRANGVNKIYKLNSTVPSPIDNIQYFIIYTNIHTFRKVIELISSHFDLDNRPENRYHIICVPKISYVFEKILEEQGLYMTTVKLYSLQWQPIHIDNGILSLEIPQMYKSLLLNHDLMLLPMYSRSLLYLSFVVGKPKLSLGLGHYATTVLNQFNAMYDDLGEDKKVNSDFGALVIMDRNMDYPSVLLTPLTYAALLKETYDVRCGICEHKKTDDSMYDNKFNIVTSKNPVQIILNGVTDSVYGNIRDRYFTEVTAVLSNLTKELRAEGETSREMALDEIKNFVKTRLQAATSKKNLITSHLNASETIINVLGHKIEKIRQVEHNIMHNTDRSGNYSHLGKSLMENDKLITLRLLCLLSITQKLTDSEVKDILTRYHHEFGYKYGYLYNNLIKAGFIEDKTSSSNILTKLPMLLSNNFYTNASKLKQIPEVSITDIKYPTCPSYVFGGCYVPLITTIASLLLSGAPLKEIESKLEVLGPVNTGNNENSVLEQRSLILFIVGGVTFAEIAACNLLEKLTGSKITLISDNIISGNDIAESLISGPIP